MTHTEANYKFGKKRKAHQNYPKIKTGFSEKEANQIKKRLKRLGYL